jgi:hypothetical protein
MTDELIAGVLPTLARRGLRPPGELALLVVGSRAVGWANPGSDLDLVSVIAEPFTDDRMLRLDVPLTPDRVQTVAFQEGPVRWEVRFWLDDQVDQLLAKVSWWALEHDEKVADRLTELEQVFLERLLTCVPVAGADWVTRRREELGASAFRAIVLTQALAEADTKAETALHQLAAGDAESAVLSARDAFGFAMDALLVHCGQYGRLTKWRARRFRAAAPAFLSFDEYWAIETMRDLDPAAPGKWVEDVVRVCKDVSMEVEL